jgi:signal peptidase
MTRYDTEITQPIPVVPAPLAYSATGQHRAAPPSEPTSSDARGNGNQPQGWWHWVVQFFTWLLLLGAVAILATVIIIPKAAGAQTYTVLTSSMRPHYPPGTLIVVRKRPAADINVGDVITYQIKSDEPDVITHRVQSISLDQQGQPVFVAKGDNNRVEDPKPVRAVQVRGELWYSVPYLGYVNNWIGGSTKSLLVMVGAGLLFAYALWEMVGGFRDDRRKKERETTRAVEP